MFSNLGWRDAFTPELQEQEQRIREQVTNKL
jgi:hypothetical protein